jgi:glucan-binding YG repeat protein
MSQLTSFIEQRVYENIINNNIKTTQNAVKSAYAFISTLPSNTILDVIATDPKFKEMHAYMMNIIAYNLSIKLVEYSTSDTIKNLVNDGYLIQTAEKPADVAEKPADVAEKPINNLVCKTVKPNTTIPKKLLSWCDDDEDEAYEKEQLSKLEKEKADFEEYKSQVLKNNADWSIKVAISDAKTKNEIDNILQRHAALKTKAEQAKAEQAKAEQAKAEQAKAEQAKAEQAKENTSKNKVSVPVLQKTENKLDSRFYTKPPTYNNNSNVNINNPNNLKYNKKPERLKTVTSSRFFMDGDKKYNKVPEHQDWYAWSYDTETMLPYGWRKIGTAPDKYLTSENSPFLLINNGDGTWSVQEVREVKLKNGDVKFVTEYVTIEYYIWCLTPPYYRKFMKQPAAN